MLDTRDLILLEKLIDTYGRNAVYEEIMNSRLKRKLGAIGVAGAVTLGGLMGAYKVAHRSPEPQQEIVKEPTIEDLIPNYYDKVDAVNSYIQSAFARKGTPELANNLGITAEEIVQICWEEDFDLGLALAAAWIETHFGTAGVCVTKNTNSMYSVGAWDNGSIKATYETKADALRAYAKLVKEKFLRGRSIDKLLSTGGFVNGIGKRYASDLKYEAKLKGTRNKILATYPVLSPEYDLAVETL